MFSECGYLFIQFILQTSPQMKAQGVKSGECGGQSPLKTSHSASQFVCHMKVKYAVSDKTLPS